MPVTLPLVPTYYSAPRLNYAMAQSIQAKMDTDLLWLDRPYHIARIGVLASNSKGYPQIHSNNGTGEHYMITPDSQIGAYSFFEEDAPFETDFENDNVKYYFSLVFWCNLDVIDNTKQYDFTSELVKQTIDLLKFFQAENIKTETRPEKIFDKYSGVKQELKQHLMRRFSAFKISFTVNAPQTDSCDPDVLDTCAQNIKRIQNMDTATRNCIISTLNSLYP